MTSVFKKKSKAPEAGKTWLHASESLLQGSVVYNVKLVGVTEVAQAKGTDVVREAIKKVKFANHIKKSEAGVKGSKLRKVELKISIDNLRVEDAKTKEELYSYPLHRISYCADDKRDKKLFAFIAKDTGMPSHNCYVFECEKMAEELTLTVGQAFELAYRRFLERKAGSEQSQKQMTEMQEKIKTAEDEKEALKQKIAQLEVAAQQGGPTNGSNNVVPQDQTKPDEFDLLGGFGGFEVTSAPKTQEAPAQNAWPFADAGQEMSFDPFAAATPQAQAAVSPSADLHEFSPEPTAAALPQPPPPMGMIPQALPPPPTKESIKATNRRNASSGHLATVTPQAAPASMPTPPPVASPSDDLLQLGAGMSNSNPFAAGGGVNGVDPFSVNSFDPFASRPSADLDSAIGNMQREFQGLQEGFSRGLVIDQNSFTGAM